MNSTVEVIHTVMGSGKDLSVLQMSARAGVIFVVGIILIRLSGRRSFGMRTPFDNVMTILLGAILSRAVAGVSPFLSTIAAATTITLLHRFCAWIALYSDYFGKIIKGSCFVLYKDGEHFPDNMKRCFISDEDLKEGIRTNGNLGKGEDAKAVYMERNGEISVVKE